MAAVNCATAVVVDRSWMVEASYDDLVKRFTSDPELKSNDALLNGSIKALEDRFGKIADYTILRDLLGDRVVEGCEAQLDELDAKGAPTDAERSYLSQGAAADAYELKPLKGTAFEQFMFLKLFSSDPCPKIVTMLVAIISEKKGLLKPRYPHLASLVFDDDKHFANFATLCHAFSAARRRECRLLAGQGVRQNRVPGNVSGVFELVQEKMTLLSNLLEKLDQDIAKCS